MRTIIALCVSILKIFYPQATKDLVVSLTTRAKGIQKKKKKQSVLKVNFCKGNQIYIHLQTVVIVDNLFNFYTFSRIKINRIL